jgi:hypothetical protein
LGKKRTLAGTSKPPKRAGRAGRDGRVSQKVYPPILQDLENFLKGYIVFQGDEVLVVASWVMAAWLTDVWDRFPNLAITSPEKRCGKTHLLELLEMITPNARYTPNISPAAVYRWIEQNDPKPTLLLDEAQSIQRRFSETSEVMRELLNAGIDKSSKVVRMGGEHFDEVKDFSVYCPKAISAIGDFDGVLADRCLAIRLKRKTATDVVLPFRSRLIGPLGEKLKARLEKWAAKNKKKVSDIFDHLDVFPIKNDRLAELLLPLQAVLTVVAEDRLPDLAEYAKAIDKQDAETESPGIRLLTACRELFAASTDPNKPRPARHFIKTTELISNLAQRTEEPWRRWTRGQLMTPEALAVLLRPFGIRSQMDKRRTAKGFYATQFEETWQRYLPPPPSKNPSNPSIPSKRPAGSQV